MRLRAMAWPALEFLMESAARDTWDAVRFITPTTRPEAVRFRALPEAVRSGCSPSSEEPLAPSALPASAASSASAALRGGDVEGWGTRDS